MNRLAILGFFFLAPSTLPQTNQFSADMVDKDKNGGTNQSKIYVGTGKMRIEGMTGQPGAMIVDYGTLTAYVLMPKDKVYMQMNMQDGKSQFYQSLSLFAPTDPADPCAQ